MHIAEHLFLIINYCYNYKALNRTLHWCNLFKIVFRRSEGGFVTQVYVSSTQQNTAIVKQVEASDKKKCIFPENVQASYGQQRWAYRCVTLFTGPVSKFY